LDKLLDHTHGLSLTRIFHILVGTGTFLDLSPWLLVVL